MAKLETKEMARMMAKRMMGAMDKETSRRRSRTMMIITMIRVLEKTTMKTHLLMRMHKTNGENRSRSARMLTRSEKLIKQCIQPAWIRRTLD